MAGTIESALLGAQAGAATLTGSQTLTNKTISGGSNTLSGPIVGVTDASSAASGNLGEYIEGRVTSATSVPNSTGQYGDLTSVSLTAGDWDVSAMAMVRVNTAVSYTVPEIGISTTSGNNGTGLVYGTNSVGIGVSAVASDRQGGSIPNYRMSLSGTTTVYLKFYATWASGVPQYLCRLSARRVR